jgi:metal-sulfur cluster biosynthetic enzyme
MMLLSFILFSLSLSYHFQSSQHNNTTELEMTPTTQPSQPAGQILTAYQEHLQGIFG